MKQNKKRNSTRAVPTEPEFHLSTPQYRGDTLALAIEDAKRRAERYEDWRAQHGPVKVIMKDGRLLQ